MFNSNANSFFLDYRPADSVDAICTLSIDYVGGRYMPENFQRVIEVPNDLSLLKLHLFVQHVAGFNDAQIDDFYLASSLRGRKTWYKRNGVWISENQAALSLPVHEIFAPRTNRKLFYSFEFDSEWIIRVSKTSADDMPLPDQKYPRVIQEKGVKPI